MLQHDSLRPELKTYQEGGGPFLIWISLLERKVIIAMMHMPKLFMVATERIIPLIKASFLCGYGITNIDNIGNITPSAHDLNMEMLEETVDIAC